MSILLASAETPAQRVGEIGRRLRNTGSTVVATYLYVYHSVWSHPYLTPEEVFEAFGTNAVEVFSFVTIVEALYPERIIPIPAGWTLTPHEDGRITPTYVAPPESSSESTPEIAPESSSSSESGS